MTMPRILADIILAGSVLFLPWWASLLIGSAFFFAFDFYYELLIAGLLADLLYGAPISKFGGFTAVSAVGVLLVCVPLFSVRKRMRV